MATQFQQPGSGPQGQLHPTVTYGQPGGQQAQVLPPQGQAGYAAPAGVQPQVMPQGQAGYYQYSADRIPPAPGQQQAPQAAPVYVQGQGQQAGAPQGYPQVPAQNGGYPQPPAAQPYGAPNYPSQSQGQQGGQRLNIDPNTILDGPGVPPELRGRRFGQVMSAYSNLAEDFVRRQGFQRSGGQPGVGQSQQRQQEPQGQQHGQQPQGQQRQQPTDWRQEIRGIVQEVVAPLQQRTTAQSAHEALTQARQRIPDFAELEQDIVQSLQGAGPDALANIAVWESAADLARGRRMRQGQLLPPPHGSQPQVGLQQIQGPNPGGQHVVQTQYGPVAVPPNRAAPQVNGVSQQFGGQQSVAVQGYYPQQPQAVPAQSAQIPQYQFFTEGPTPPQMHSISNMLTPQERDYAKKMGMTDEDYMAWRGGVIR